MYKSTQYRDHCPPLTRPRNFTVFWSNTLEQLAKQNMAVNLLQHETRSDGLTLQWLSYHSFGDAVIQAYYLTWNDDRPRPLVIHTHGYIGQCDVMWQWAERDLNVFGFDIRGLGRSHAAIPERSPNGYVLTGIESEQNSVLRGAVCDYVRAHDVAKQCLSNPPQRTIFYGNSFGGALSLMAAAITQTPNLLVTAVPTLGWAEGRRQLVRNGSGLEINRYLERHPEQTTKVMHVLKYFDTMNFADMLSCPSLIGLGLHDEIVPAPTVYAIINRLTCPHEVREFPVSHSTGPQEQLWSHFESEWLALALSGTPDSFGR